MNHFLIQLATDQDDFDKDRLNAYFRQLPRARTLAQGHGQWFELIDTEKEHFHVLGSLAPCLKQGDRLGVWEIPPRNSHL